MTPGVQVLGGNERSPQVGGTSRSTYTPRRPPAPLEEPNGGVRITPDSALAGSFPSDMEVRKIPKQGNALSGIATTIGGLLAICWQQTSQRGSWRAFVLVGVTGIEPVTSAV
jgi:hypothetical protein